MRKLKLDELHRPSLEEFKEQVKIPVIVVLDNIRSALNVGSIFRTADGFAIERICLCGISAVPPHKEINKTAIGATSSVDWTYNSNIADLLKDLKSKGYIILGVEQTNNSVLLRNYAIKTDQKYVLVFGNEVEGISESAIDCLDQAIEIEQYGTKHSFNVAVCSGMVLYTFSNSIRKS